jgi:hypothetical protein
MIIGPTGFADLRKDGAVKLALEGPLEERREIVRFYLAAQNRQLFHHRIPYKFEIPRPSASLRRARRAQGHTNHYRSQRNK